MGDQQTLDIAFWSTVAQITAVFMFVLVAEARRTAKSWFESGHLRQMRAIHRIGIGLFALIAVLLVYVLSSSLNSLEFGQPSAFRKVLAVTILSIVAVLLAMQPVVAIATISNADIAWNLFYFFRIRPLSRKIAWRKEISMRDIRRLRTQRLGARIDLVKITADFYRVEMKMNNIAGLDLKSEFEHTSSEVLEVQKRLWDEITDISRVESEIRGYFVDVESRIRRIIVRERKSSQAMKVRELRRILDDPQRVNQVN